MIFKFAICFDSSSANVGISYPLEVVARGSEPQLQVGKKFNDVTQRFKGLLIM